MKAYLQTYTTQKKWYGEKRGLPSYIPVKILGKQTATYTNGETFTRYLIEKKNGDKEAVHSMYLFINK